MLGAHHATLERLQLLVLLLHHALLQRQQACAAQLRGRVCLAPAAAARSSASVAAAAAAQQAGAGSAARWPLALERLQHLLPAAAQRGHNVSSAVALVLGPAPGGRRGHRAQADMTGGAKGRGGGSAQAPPTSRRQHAVPIPPKNPHRWAQVGPSSAARRPSSIDPSVPRRRRAEAVMREASGPPAPCLRLRSASDACTSSAAARAASNSVVQASAMESQLLLLVEGCESRERGDKGARSASGDGRSRALTAPSSTRTARESLP